MFHGIVQDRPVTVALALPETQLLGMNHPEAPVGKEEPQVWLFHQILQRPELQLAQAGREQHLPGQRVFRTGGDLETQHHHGRALAFDHVRLQCHRQRGPALAEYPTVLPAFRAAQSEKHRGFPFSVIQAHRQTGGHYAV